MGSLIDEPPIQSNFYPITYLNQNYSLNWYQNNDYDFVSYQLYVSDNQDMVNSLMIYETNEVSDTSFIVEMDYLKYYQKSYDF